MHSFFFMAGLLLAATVAATAQTTLSAGQAAPEFTAVNASSGQPFSLSTLRGRPVLLSFQRFVGCPVCNLRTHQLIQAYDSLKQQGMELVVVYESSAENMRQYLADTPVPFPILADPDARLYALYGVERSFGKMMRGMSHGMMGKAKAGGKLYKAKLKRDGSLTRVEADFLIAPDGRVHTAHYGHYVGDDLPLESVRDFARQQPKPQTD